MFPKIYYLVDSMDKPKRCYGGILFAFSLSGELNIRIEGEDVQGNICLVNDSELYQIKSKDILIYYFPASRFKQVDMHIFDNILSINNHIALKQKLLSLFNHFINEEFHSKRSQNLINDILLSLSYNEKGMNQHSQSILFEIKTYILKHLHEKITLDKISQNFYMSSSNISKIFKNQMNISFYEYMASLRIAKSIGSIIGTSNTIETIARRWGYANATNYIIHFKKYMGTTPKKYRANPYESHFLTSEELTSDSKFLQNIDLGSAFQSNNIQVSINDENISQSKIKYFNLVDIGEYNNLDLILNEEVFKYKNFSQYKLDSYIYISEPIDHISTKEYKERILRLRNILKTKVSIAIKIHSIESFNFIKKIVEELHFLESEQLPSSNLINGNVLLLFNLTNMKVSDINNIQSTLYGTKILTSVDITDIYNNGKTEIDSEILLLNPNFYTIDFLKLRDAKLKSLTHETFKEFQQRLNHFLEKIQADKNVIFLNYESVYPTNLLGNIGGFLETSLYIKKYLAGASIQFNMQDQEYNNLAIFDETENKTPFFFLGVMLLNFSRYPCYYGSNHLITKNMHSYNILLYNSDNTITNDLEDYTKTFYIDFDPETESKDLIISSELLNHTYGSTRGIISQNISNRSDFPNALKYKLSQYNSPLLEIETHNFINGPYVVKLPPRSVMMITIYMN